MSNRLFVGSLPYSIDDNGLKALFETIGKVIYARVIRHPDTKLSRGFGFVEMSSQEEGERAIAEFNGKEVSGREIKVNEAKPREDRGGRGGQAHLHGVGRRLQHSPLGRTGEC